jgi:probable rRNA maturation factor
LVARVLQTFSRLVPAARGRAVTVAFVDARTMRRLNLTYRGVNAPTDVLSFPPAPFPGQPLAWGEVVIGYPVAVRQARAAQTSVRAEVTALLIHGLAHLAGYDHDTTRRAARMGRLEAKVLRQFMRRSKN